MTCPTCHTDNPPGSRFCMECGTRLAVGDRVPAAEPSTALRPGIDPADPVARAAPPIETPSPTDDRSHLSPTFGNAGPLPARPLNPAELPSTHPEWRMSDAGPLPEQRRRRWVLWLGVALGVCLLLCVALVVWSGTIGRGTLDAVATQVSAEATRQAQGR